MALVTVTPPPAEPITLAEAKQHLRVTSEAEDFEIAAQLAAARGAVETITGRRLVEQVLDWQLDRLPGELRLPVAPVRSVDSISYVDTAGATQVLNAAVYQADVTSEPGRIVPRWGQVWPQLEPRLHAVTVRLSCGYAAAPGFGANFDYGANVPPDIKAAIKLMLAMLFENRSAVAPVVLHELPMSWQLLLLPYKVWGF